MKTQMLLIFVFCISNSGLLGMFHAIRTLPKGPLKEAAMQQRNLVDRIALGDAFSEQEIRENTTASRRILSAHEVREKLHRLEEEVDNQKIRIKDLEDALKRKE